MSDTLYLLFKGNAAQQVFVGVYDDTEHAIAMASHLLRTGQASTIKIDVYLLNVPIPIRMPIRANTSRPKSRVKRKAA